jgi:hypothetical protein
MTGDEQAAHAALLLVRAKELRSLRFWAAQHPDLGDVLYEMDLRIAKLEQAGREILHREGRAQEER